LFHLFLNAICPLWLFSSLRLDFVFLRSFSVSFFFLSFFFLCLFLLFFFYNYHAPEKSSPSLIFDSVRFEKETDRVIIAPPPNKMTQKRLDQRRT
ncbi:hypothetical protein NUU24_26300, partial [Escherichia coli]|uniref:hypothetical protein n=1 Tax=Escherichia coli TaxID=562 RepID=UPI00215004CF